MTDQANPQLVHELKDYLEFSDNDFEEISALLHADPTVQCAALRVAREVRAEAEVRAEVERRKWQAAVIEKYNPALREARTALGAQKQRCKKLEAMLRRRHELYDRLEHQLLDLDLFAGELNERAGLWIHEQKAIETNAKRKMMQSEREEFWKQWEEKKLGMYNMREWPIGRLYEVALKLCDEFRIALAQRRKVNQAGGQRVVREFVKDITRKVDAMGRVIYEKRVDLIAPPVRRQRRASPQKEGPKPTAE